MNKSKCFISGLCLFVALFSCKKDDANIGGEISDNPGSLVTSQTDTFKIVTYSRIEDSVITSERSKPMLGAYKSEELGLVVSGLFASLTPDSLDRTFPTTDFKIDSFYLKLDIVDVYGLPTNQTFEVYRATEFVNEDSLYYSIDSLITSDLIGIITINQTDSNSYVFDLDSAYGSNLLSASIIDMRSKDDFQSFFGGIYIKPIISSLNDNEGAIYLLNRTGVSLHLKYSTTNNTNSSYDLEMEYNLSTDNQIFAKYNHNFNNSEVNDVLIDTSLGQDFFYTQGLQGAIAKINFPTVQNWYSASGAKSYLINKFEFSIFAEKNNTFELPGTLMLTYLSTEGIRTFTTSILNEQSNTYTFTISPSEVSEQLKLNMFNDMDFNISHPFPGSNPHQVKLLGRNSDTTPALNISYTKY